VGLCAWPYTVDDAYIVARYAARIVSGLGYTSSGKELSDGVTGPLWLVPGMFAARLRGDPVVVAKVAGLSAMALAVVLVLRRLRARAQGVRYVFLAVVLVACQPTLGTWGVAGLETGAATLALCVALLASTARPRPRLWSTSLALAALPWLRPELAFAALAVLGVLSLRIGARSWPAWLATIASALATCVFRQAMFGELLPLAYYAKLGTLGDGVEYTLRSLLVLSAGSGLIAVAFAIRHGRSDDRAAGAVLIAHTLAVVLAGGDWMPGFRLFVPVLPLYVALVAVGVQSMLRARRGAWLVAVTLAPVLGLSSLDLVTRIPEIRDGAHQRAQAARALGAVLHARATRIALVDVGQLGTLADRELVDLGGITDPEIARLPGGHLDKHIPESLIARRAPDAILLHSTNAAADLDASGQLRSLHGSPVERRVAAMPWVRGRFAVASVVRYARGYDYILLLPPAAHGDATLERRTGKVSR
jgi:hypothetical protein